MVGTVFRERYTGHGEAPEVHMFASKSSAKTRNQDKMCSTSWLELRPQDDPRTLIADGVTVRPGAYKRGGSREAQGETPDHSFQP